MKQNNAFNVSLDNAPIAPATAADTPSLRRASFLFAASLSGFIGASLLLASL
ncbi:hypothetical protein [Microvirga sp. M2]|uniref:hypothetical protein n=1 Tax=Microvirga sp. M2 TaxID=3073270 RepID=UPI0039C3F3F4